MGSLVIAHGERDSPTEENEGFEEDKGWQLDPLEYCEFRKVRQKFYLFIYFSIYSLFNLIYIYLFISGLSGWAVQGDHGQSFK